MRLKSDPLPDDAGSSPVVRLKVVSAGMVGVAGSIGLARMWNMLGDLIHMTMDRSVSAAAL